MLKALNEGGLMLLTALLSDGHTEASACFVMDKQKLRGKKAEPPVLLVTQLVFESAKEARHPSTTHPKQRVCGKYTGDPTEPCSQVHVNCIFCSDLLLRKIER